LTDSDKGALVDDNDDENYENIPLIGTMALVPQIVDALKKEIKDRFILQIQIQIYLKG
jgi:hypothetical protein